MTSAKSLEIENYNEIISSDPIRQIWQFLHIFHDLDYVEAMIKQNLQIENDKHNQNIRKQAQQISYCLKQAEEYFFAAAQVSIATKPLLLYYGAICLARSLIMFRNNGEFSLDFLRKNKRHNHHGLELHGDIDGSLKHSPLGLFLDNYCKVYFNEMQVFWGGFGLFYNSLAPPAIKIDMQVFESQKSGYLIQKTPIGAPLADIQTYQDKKLQLFDLLLQCPDMLDTLRYFTGYYLATPLHSVRVETTIHVQSESDDLNIILDFYVNDILTEDDLKILNEEGLELIETRNSNYHFQRVSTSSEGDKKEKPSTDIETCFLTEGLNGHNYLYIPSKGWGPYITEPAALYILTFSFGWLARYYPDIWLKAIDDISVREIIEKFTEIFLKKFPLLILDQLTLTKHNVHV